VNSITKRFGLTSEITPTIQIKSICLLVVSLFNKSGCGVGKKLPETANICNWVFRLAGRRVKSKITFNTINVVAKQEYDYASQAKLFKTLMQPARLAILDVQSMCLSSGSGSG